MNIFNKTLLAISLACAIALTSEAASTKDIAKEIYNKGKDIAKVICDKKKTTASGLALGTGLSYAGSKAVDWFYSSWPKYMTKEEMLDRHFNLDDGILFAAERGFKNMRKEINMARTSAILLALYLTYHLISKAHEKNFFGENPKSKNPNKAKE